MSPDEIFAAQMWSWPDPIIKRDPSGCVLIVNAMFLQIYGGRVENWAGQILQGWPAPGPQGYTNRFETRMGEGENEIVYDWVETTLGDGNALALARDVTCFQQAIPIPAAPEAMQYEAQAPIAPPAAAQIPASPPAQAAAVVQTVAETPPQAPVQAAPVAQQVVAQPPAPEALPLAAAPIEPAPPPPSPAPEPAPVVAQAEPPAPAPIPEPAPVEPAVAPAPVAEAPVAEAPPPPPAPEPEPAPTPAPAPVQREEREFERRALPIENGDSVLGTNWRDAVIAKAVGAAVGPEEETAIAHADDSDDNNSDAGGDGIGSGLRILLAEDNAINALLTRTLLEAEGCNVETVEDGKLAVEAVENNNYDLIFMDMRMPNMDGLEATRKIRAMGSKTEKLPIIALTANAFDDDRNACFDSGMNDFMTKPVSAEELVEMVKNWAINKQDSAAA